MCSVTWLFVVGILGLALGSPINPTITKLINQAHELEVSQNRTRSLEEANYAGLAAEFDDLAEVMSIHFPYHGKPHSDYAQDCVDWIVQRNKLKGRIKRLDPQGENNYQRGMAHASSIGRLAMSAHDCAYEEIAISQRYNLQKSIAFTDAAEQDDDVVVDQETNIEYGGQIGVKLGKAHEVASGKKLLAKIGTGDWFDVENEQEMADLRMILVMIAVTDVSWGANPKLNYVAMVQQKIPDTKKKWDDYLIDPDPHTIDATFTRAMWTGMDVVAHAADLGYFLDHFRVFHLGETRNPVNLCHLLACFGEFYAYGGIPVNAVIKNSDNAAGFFDQWVDFLGAQKNFRSFVWGKHIKAVTTSTEFKEITLLDDIFRAELKYATDALADWYTEKPKKRNLPVSVCNLMYGLIYFAPAATVNLGVTTPTGLTAYTMLGQYANSLCVDHAAFADCTGGIEIYA